MTEPAKPRRYEIRVRGVLSDTLLEAFPGLQARIKKGETVLSGELADRSALHGVLSQIEALGLELLELYSDAEASESIEADDDTSPGAARGLGA
jgi:hypothetical protein